MITARKKIKTFIGSVIICSVIFAGLGAFLIGTAAPSTPAPADTYTPPSDPDTLLRVTVGGNNIFIGFMFSKNIAYVSFTPGQETLPGYDFTESYIHVPDEVFISFVDNFNGAIYTDNRGEQYVIMGKNALDIIYRNEYDAALIAAEILKKLLNTDISQLEKGFVYLVENSQCNVSFIEWATYKDELQAVNTVHAVSAQTLANIMKAK